MQIDLEVGKVTHWTDTGNASMLSAEVHTDHNYYICNKNFSVELGL